MEAERRLAHSCPTDARLDREDAPRCERPQRAVPVPAAHHLDGFVTVAKVAHIGPELPAGPADGQVCHPDGVTGSEPVPLLRAHEMGDPGIVIGAIGCSPTHLGVGALGLRSLGAQTLLLGRSSRTARNR